MSTETADVNNIVLVQEGKSFLEALAIILKVSATRSRL